MRVVAGTLGGRRLVAPRGMATRPTSDRVREALFSALGDVGGARVLDPFAGTGALGIEALSRGAAHATFVEASRPALVALAANLKTLALGPRARVIEGRAERVLSMLEGPHDLVLLDPPYAELEVALLFARELVARDWLSPEATLVVEHRTRDEPGPIEGLTRRTPRRYGDTSLTFYERA